ncbi:hypothetical protein FALCPG4_012291 [Fusarium falciforme]
MFDTNDERRRKTGASSELARLTTPSTTIAVPSRPRSPCPRPSIRSVRRTPESSDLSPGRHINRRFIMAGHGHHSFNGPPKPPVAHVPRIYRFTATALGAGMWFFLMYRAKKDGAVLLGLKHPWDH